ncbi:mucin-5AC-like [Trichogramma pretiosum]|uniref:mucin-5AC-like n=1 Tax=Trichogramma pretiosum TaxID=7493 RepID=UPI000C71C58D|nr:mucin-5AC-like [Trichogramma pretiosum]
MLLKSTTFLLVGIALTTASPINFGNFLLSMQTQVQNIGKVKGSPITMNQPSEQTIQSAAYSASNPEAEANVVTEAEEVKTPTTEASKVSDAVTTSQAPTTETSTTTTEVSKVTEASTTTQAPTTEKPKTTAAPTTTQATTIAVPSTTTAPKSTNEPTTVVPQVTTTKKPVITLPIESIDLIHSLLKGIKTRLGKAYVKTYDEQKDSIRETIGSIKQTGKMGVESGMNLLKNGLEFFFIAPTFGKHLVNEG